MLDREAPTGRSNTNSVTGARGDERNEEQNPSPRVKGQPQQPGGDGPTLEAAPKVASLRAAAGNEAPVAAAAELESDDNVTSAGGIAAGAPSYGE